MRPSTEIEVLKSSLCFYLVPFECVFHKNHCLSIMASLLIIKAHFFLLTYTGGKCILFIIYKSKVLRGPNRAKAQALVLCLL